MASSEWHWEQGVKFAVEGIKTSLLLNGAAAIALVTFANTHDLSRGMRLSIFLFAVGAMVSATAFLAAYMTQLEYGNGEIPNITADQHDRSWKRGQRWNKAALVLVLISVFVFLTASFVLLQIWPTKEGQISMNVKER